MPALPVMSGADGTVRQRCGHSLWTSGGPGWPGAIIWRPVPPAASIDALTGTLVGLHATDPATPYLSLWARIPGCSVADLDAALYDDRTLVKHLAMRRTLWVVRPEDLPSIQSAASDRVAANEHRRLVADAEGAGCGCRRHGVAGDRVRGRARSPGTKRSEHGQAVA